LVVAFQKNQKNHPKLHRLKTHSMEKSFILKLKDVFSTDGRENKSALANGMLLFFTLVTVFVIPISSIEYLEILFACSVTGIVVFSVLSLKENGKFTKIFAVFSLMVIWSSYFVDTTFFRLGLRFINFFFFLFLVFSLIRQISTIATVTFKVIVDSISGYLLLGFAFSLFVTAISLIIPGAYSTSISGDLETKFIEPIQNNIYYTFMTFTTTGYGDIVPIHPFSKSLAVLIGVSGQLYVAIIISMLIGKYASSKKLE
jgi:voltage-gated potassium channel